jgi:ribosomal protein S13
MKTSVLLLSIIIVLSVLQANAQSNSEFTPEELEFLEQAKQKGASEDDLNQLRLMIKVKRDGEKKWSEEELNDIDRLLLSKWNGMRRALAQGDVDSAVSYFSERTRENYRKRFSNLTKKQLSQLSEDLRDVKFIRVRGNHDAEYDIQIVKDGKSYSYILSFEKNVDDIWEIRGF